MKIDKEKMRTVSECEDNVDVDERKLILLDRKLKRGGYIQE
jgi:hypothetical protein